MRLISFRVQNFKSVKDTGFVSFGNQDIIVLAGQNEAGKSAVLEALNYFYEGPADNYDRLQRRPDGETSVTCVYALTDSDLEYLKKKAPGNEPLHEFLQKNREITLERQGPDHNLGVVQESTNAIGKFFKKDPDEAGGETTYPGWVEFATELKGPALRNQTMFDDSFTNLLPGEIKAGSIEENNAVMDFQTVFDVDFAKAVENEGRAVSALESKVTRNATDDLNKYWRQKLDVGTKYSFKVKVNRNPTNPADSLIEFTVENRENDPTPLYMEQKSRGFRWFSAFNLRLRALAIESDHPEDLLLLIDEPGEGLHEKAQLDLKAVLEELAEKGARIIYSTHNPLLIGTQGDELARVRIVANLPEDGTKVYTLAQYAAKPSVAAQDALSPLVTALGLTGITAIRRNTALSVLTEGITDHYYYKAFGHLMGYKQAYFIPSVGANNIPHIVPILLGWGEKFKVILDDDRTGRSVAKILRQSFYAEDPDLADKVIYRPRGSAGVEEVLSGPDFRKYVIGDTSKKAEAQTNIELADGNKELLARLFYEKIAKGELTIDDFDDTSKANINKVVDFLKEPF